MSHLAVSHSVEYIAVKAIKLPRFGALHRLRSCSSSSFSPILACAIWLKALRWRRIQQDVHDI